MILIITPRPAGVDAGAGEARARHAAGIPRVVAICGVQGWRWDWARDVRALGLPRDAAAAGQQKWRQLAR